VVLQICGQCCEFSVPHRWRISAKRAVRNNGQRDTAIAHAEQVTRQMRRALDALVRGNGGTTGP
jgi:hypothetical protein